LSGMGGLSSSGLGGAPPPSEVEAPHRLPPKLTLPLVVACSPSSLVTRSTGIPRRLAKRASSSVPNSRSLPACREERSATYAGRSERLSARTVLLPALLPGLVRGLPGLAPEAARAL